LEVLTLPVADVDRAVRFYTSQVGFTLDVGRRRRSSSGSA
jgi:catechol 2,3-dioxygenase-like lactoylglutathione lyase family enzyme